jgi:ubiquinone/menaquinone biosynthesis C-methylase UbiE
MSHAHHDQHHFIPAMGHRALTPFYDLFVRVIARERTFKRRLVERLRLQAGTRVLDVGCGTGTLVVMLASAHPDAEVTGIDVDAEIVARARAKAQAAGTPVGFRVASATELPFADGSFDRVTSTLMAHHLATPAKEQMFSEIRRVLAPQGELHLVDFGPARTRVGRSAQRLLRPHGLGDNFEGKLPSLMSSAGFVEVLEEERIITALGPFVFWRARRDARSAL